MAVQTGIRKLEQVEILGKEKESPDAKLYEYKQDLEHKLESMRSSDRRMMKMDASMKNIEDTVEREASTLLENRKQGKDSSSDSFIVPTLQMVSTEHIRGIEENNTSSIQNEKDRLVNEVHDANNNIDHHHLPKENIQEIEKNLITSDIMKEGEGRSRTDFERSTSQFSLYSKFDKKLHTEELKKHLEIVKENKKTLKALAKLEELRTFRKFQLEAKLQNSLQKIEARKKERKNAQKEYENYSKSKNSERPLYQKLFEEHKKKEEISVKQNSHSCKKEQRTEERKPDQLNSNTIDEFQSSHRRSFLANSSIQEGSNMINEIDTKRGLSKEINLPFLTNSKTNSRLNKQFAKKFSSKVCVFFSPDRPIAQKGFNENFKSHRVLHPSIVQQQSSPVIETLDIPTSRKFGLQTSDLAKFSHSLEQVETSEQRKARLDKERTESLKQMRLEKKKFDYLRQAFPFKERARVNSKLGAATLLRESERIDGRIGAIERDRPELRFTLPESRLR